MSLLKDTLVEHPRFGRGRVRMDDGDTIMVRFDDGIQECLASELTVLKSLEDLSTGAQLDSALSVVTRVLANCIWSVNDAWGVFSRSRINLLPHQLWVCQRVLKDWPTRWLVADDVGLGKTIEAGLILSPLIASGRVQRVLILAPASLVGQWNERLREMFNINISIYDRAVDTEKAGYWNAHNRIVASAQTLRMDKDGRWDRLVEAEPWDLLLVDEAHHMNCTEDERTLALKLVERLEARGKIQSMVLFTGTPHRGKDYAFLSLLKLLRPDDFDPDKSLESQVHKLREVMIRNNKQRVTDMAGKPLFTPVQSITETYTYTDEETAFYEKLTAFISSGKAYAADMNQQRRRMAMLVLITMQKLASSSIAAVSRALRNRLQRLKNAKHQLAINQPDLERLQEFIEADDPANNDEQARLEEMLSQNLSEHIHLNPEEIPALEELLDSADAVLKETKIERILEVVDENFADESVLFFTEYKATQATLMSALQDRFGEGCVTFINGDGFIEGVMDQRGRSSTHRMKRAKSAELFNSGNFRFMVSTEAAGEGIDLQDNCSTLIHVDLPWNPMRLHQRVGRISRYGQTKPVDVVTLHNPDTVESRIWDCLDQKLDRITFAFQGGMDDPEDMRQLVLGMASPRMFNTVFAEAPKDLKGERLEDWFNSNTATFGGEGAIEVVRRMFGNVARFNFGEVADRIPRVDLPDLIPYIKAVLKVAGHRPTQPDEKRLILKTPRSWRDDFRIVEQYDLLFARDPKPAENEDTAGVGLLVIDRALKAGVNIPKATLAALGELEHTLVLFTVRDKVTGSEGAVRKVVVGVIRGDDGTDWKLLRDWEVIKLLNNFADRPASPVFDAKSDAADLRDLVSSAEGFLHNEVGGLDLPFRVPTVETLACLVPGVSGD